ncbi:MULTISPECIES: hypothetical protein [Streptomyces]|uniref:Uncharacterized protein n=2 Tax=Streptomyces TaxID=1883 RepID=A0A0W7WXA3_9ACTN|nr:MULTISPECIES: hypothetical protein [Streptomyces]KUF15210.1 hypothetical protein AT728_27425 [Streptomyces silvensis]MVO85440.1 hypothetical protein [Streptomyces typhae]
MDPVIVGAVATVAVSIVNGIVKAVKGRWEADVEIARITETGRSDLIRHATARDLRPGPFRSLPADLDGGSRRGGSTQH